MSSMVIGLITALLWLSGFAAGVATLFVVSALYACKGEMPPCPRYKGIEEKGKQ